MLNQFSRTELLFGKEAMEKLSNSRVAVFGIGGVGGYAVEALARSGVGELDLIDDDKLCLTNINRQIIATRKTVGKYKVDVSEERVHDICPDIKVNTYKCFYMPDTADQFDFTQYDYIIDAIDTVTAKLDIAKQCKTRKIRLIACLGTGNRLDPERLRLGDITETAGCGCPLAKVMRRELRRRGIEHLPVLFSTEEPAKAIAESAAGRHPPGSISFVPPVAGYIIAGKCIRDIIE